MGTKVSTKVHKGRWLYFSHCALRETFVTFVVKKQVIAKQESKRRDKQKNFGIRNSEFGFVNYRITFDALIPVMEKKALCGLTPDDILQSVEISGLTGPAAISITNNIYRKRHRDINDFPKISGKLKNQLKDIFTTGLYDPESFVTSSDGTIKYLFRNNEGLVFETVYMNDGKRSTVCVSSQSGCRMGCRFCATGRFGFMGNLSAGDIINQVISLPQADTVNRIVFMGMGEPMDNIENVIKACNIFTAEWGLALSPRDITVSTVGIMPEIEHFLTGSDCNLTFSLFSPFPDERIIPVPVEKKYPASLIIETIKNFPVKKKRRFSIAYVMINGINDSEKHLNELRQLLSGSHVRINLIPYHPFGEDVNIPSSESTMHHFKHELVISGISASIRRSRGTDISAACGLLATGLKL
jgi:23S rRNA (adenine2503-C2)-methyltransferase